MRRLTLLKLLMMSLASAAVLSVLYFFALRTLNESSSQTHRQELALTIAKEIEKSDQPETAIAEYVRNHVNSRGDIRLPLWLVSEAGEVLASTHKNTLPFNWGEITKSDVPHEVVMKYRAFSLTPELMSLRLDTKNPMYLVMQLAGRRNLNLVWGAPFVLIFVTVAVAIFLSLSLTFFYLQSKSKEAKEILSQLGKGDLKARFKIQRFDEIGNLMLDFNQMADQIETLIHRVQNVEQARRNLLQELSHDLRTPLTSLKTSFETLQSHFETMPKSDRSEFFSMIDGEMSYLVHLLEDLFFIAQLDEPKYKNSAKKISLSELLTGEIKSRQTSYSDGPEFVFTDTLRPSLIWGDPHLITRLFKNALDNAARFSKKQVQVRVQDQGTSWEVQIQDDGPGLSPEAIADFGTRRRHRTELISDSKNAAHFSLGLGSVIMRTIAELHQGHVDIQNQTQAHQIQGALLRMTFPKT